MLTLTNWTYIIKTILKSCQSKKAISDKIKEQRSTGFYNGMYLVDNNAIWENVIMSDDDCHKELEQLNINDVISLESFYEEREYHKMWLDYRLTYRKRRR